MDLVWLDDLDEFASETLDELDELAQDLEHRLLEEYGSNPDDEDRGVDLMSRLSGTDDPIMIARLVEADFHKDERVLTCVVSVTLTSAGVSAASGVFANVDITVTTTKGLLQLAFAAKTDGTMTGGRVQ